jgi:hypothetical protein
VITGFSAICTREREGFKKLWDKFIFRKTENTGMATREFAIINQELVNEQIRLDSLNTVSELIQATLRQQKPLNWGMIRITLGGSVIEHAREVEFAFDTRNAQSLLNAVAKEIASVKKNIATLEQQKQRQAA